jgi:mRNA interferase RelE/StbE
MKTVGFTPAARRAWRKLPASAQTRITAALQRYAASGQGDVTRLSGIEGARLRVGNHRVIFTEAGDMIEVRAVGHRRDIYR